MAVGGAAPRWKGQSRGHSAETRQLAAGEARASVPEREAVTAAHSTARPVLLKHCRRPRNASRPPEPTSLSPHLHRPRPSLLPPPRNQDAQAEREAQPPRPRQTRCPGGRGQGSRAVGLRPTLHAPAVASADPSAPSPFRFRPVGQGGAQRDAARSTSPSAAPGAWLETWIPGPQPQPHGLGSSGPAPGVVCDEPSSAQR